MVSFASAWFQVDAIDGMLARVAICVSLKLLKISECSFARIAKSHRPP